MTTEQLRKRLVIGNWKMHGSLSVNAELLNALRQGAMVNLPCDLAVCVPFPYLEQARQALGGTVVSWGAQDVSSHVQGAYTGEVSAAMLSDFSCRYVLVGHSERRTYHGETSQMVAEKAKAAIAAGLVPVVCVGETLEQQQSGATEQVIDQQLAPVLALGVNALSSIVVAYEPVWAIGTGLSATPEQAQQVHALIRERLRVAGAGHVQILYGGSVKAANAASLFAMPDIDGALVGGASLVAGDFLNIAAA